MGDSPLRSEKRVFFWALPSRYENSRGQDWPLGKTVSDTHSRTTASNWGVLQKPSSPNPLPALLRPGTSPDNPFTDPEPTAGPGFHPLSKPASSNATAATGAKRASKGKAAAILGHGASLPTQTQGSATASKPGRGGKWGSKVGETHSFQSLG